MSSKIKSLVHISQKSLKSKNKDLIDKLIKYYQDKTKSAVEKIIDMFVAIQVVDSMFNSGEITKDDMNYFFAGISMNPKSSAFRKSMCIAAKANILKKYIEYLPTASSVIFEITTLNQDVF